MVLSANLRCRQSATVRLDVAIHLVAVGKSTLSPFRNRANFPSDEATGCRQIYVVANPQLYDASNVAASSCRQIYVVANPQLSMTSDGTPDRCRQIYVVANPQHIVFRSQNTNKLSANLRCRQSATLVG